ncbi:3-hydroxyacyl-CoA dehydrogenase family protein [Streptomyces rapamycinicus]|uniref:3-hydroxyacyl-CoA dehydrogenase n=2 Tax=Streptomyces rapamycinicus TaxID=1226757 RepID=A0A0A0NP70_STRRN|nr:3-hydroxyacyl-CoA dehydrogenase family protein [Streptomyces rapamycinicus]AGP58961.1 3-hydroxyacyl-CoA dehydrogenase [Streptomyces rapamycinicus NRRL 5491]RLV77859.1 3-hydroxyacyl-CoA dehydrogenase [Streptomyces rapamycinicus NRRL 5491]UTO66740.1 3-hydroxyacyl-CoA dehydrogenase family protein [Streptomyces rapamycinicus]UTP34694.1 3-hydroxyacyl-CoA dehydrogenase family protein [Streptomyces rapamycinicus NRRL 5491]
MAGSASDTIAVVGAGVMGRNITALALGRGVDVVLVDVSADVLESARAEVAQLLRHGQFMGAFPASQATGTLTTTLSSGDVADADVVIEAITEDAALKAQVMADLSGTVPAGVPLITNTSGIPIAELAKSVRRPAELAGVHFMNPSYLIEMVEVVRGPRTGEDAMAAILSLLGRLGRKTVVVRDAPGFVTSRLLHPMINEAARIVAEGTASVEAVDQLMHGCLGHPTGPLRTADLIGLDNLADALRLLAERTGNPTFEPCELLLEKVRRGDLGRKTGRGFYNYGEVLS